MKFLQETKDRYLNLGHVKPKGRRIWLTLPSQIFLFLLSYATVLTSWKIFCLELEKFKEIYELDLYYYNYHLFL